MKIKSLIASLLFIASSEALAITGMIYSSPNINAEKLVNDIASNEVLPANQVYVGKAIGSDVNKLTTATIKDGIFTISYLTNEKCVHGQVGSDWLKLNGVSYSMNSRCLVYPSGETIKQLTFSDSVYNGEIVSEFLAGTMLKDRESNVYWSVYSIYSKPEMDSKPLHNIVYFFGMLFLIGVAGYSLYFISKHAVLYLGCNFQILFNALFMKKNKNKYKRDEIEDLQRKNKYLHEALIEAENKIRNLQYSYTEKEAELRANANSDSDKVSRSLLDKANEIIRSANERVSQLKDSLSDSEFMVQEVNNNLANANKEIIDLKNKLKDAEYKATHNNSYTDFEWLGVPTGCRDAEAIKKNYKSLSLIFHSDRSGSDSIMKMVNAARDRLLK
ncbi:J domain-containing protein [Photobacterium leiognathi]|uniref:J domain-containing protein n=1 Tax=Photobacterium leiognathi TaxID=553611 RepID=UPI0027350B2D|nr:hypothetical protein [Photobacterium leiognathi]